MYTDDDYGTPLDRLDKIEIIKQHFRHYIYCGFFHLKQYYDFLDNQKIKIYNKIFNYIENIFYNLPNDIIKIITSYIFDIDILNFNINSNYFCNDFKCNI